MKEYRLKNSLDEYEEKFDTNVYIHKMIECLMQDELIEHNITHLRICIYLKQFFRKSINAQWSMQEIVTELIQLCINPKLSNESRNMIADILETSFHYLTIQISHLRVENPDLNPEDKSFSVSKAFAANIIKILQESQGDKNMTIGAILVLKSYLASLSHEQRVVELTRFFMSYLVVLNNDILSEILKILNEIQEEEYTVDHPKMQTLLIAYEVEHTFIEWIDSVIRDCVTHKGRGLELFAIDPGICNILYQIIGVVGTNSNQCQQVFISTTQIEEYDNIVNKTK